MNHIRDIGYRLNWVLGQNGSGQNGTDKMVCTKWYTDKMVLDKMVCTKWYRQNGMAKTLRIKSSINPAPIDNMIFHQSSFYFDAFSFPLCAYHLFVTFGSLNIYWIQFEFNLIKMYIKYKIVPFCLYHFVRIPTIPFCPYHFVRTVLSATILSGHR